MRMDTIVDVEEKPQPNITDLTIGKEDMLPSTHYYPLSHLRAPAAHPERRRASLGSPRPVPRGAASCADGG